MCSFSNVWDIVVRHKLWCVVPNKFLIECLILLLLCNGDRYRVSIQLVFYRDETGYCWQLSEVMCQCFGEVLQWWFLNRPQ